MPARSMLIHDPLRFRAAFNPGHPAIRYDGRVISYGDLDRRSDRAGQALVARGVKPGDRVAILGQNSPEWLEATFGISKAGAVSVPLGYRSVARELTTIIGHSGAIAAFVDAEYLDLLKEASQGTDLDLTKVIVLDGDYEAIIQAASAEPLDVRVDDTAPYAFLYTSGTTGAPKGVIQTHRGRAVHQCLAAQEFDVREGDCVLSAAPLYNSGPIFWTLLTLSGGATVGLVRRFDAKSLDDDCERLDVNYVMLMPTLFNRWIDAGEASGNWSQPHLGMRVFLTAGEPMLSTTREKLMARFPKAGMFEHYGSTEQGAVIYMRPEDQERKAGSVGRPIFGIDVSLRDDDGNEVKPGEVGEIWSRGNAQMEGYYKQPDVTAEIQRGEWMASGDLAIRDEDGFYFIVGRKKDTIKTGGATVYPAEIETVLIEHPAVREVSVLGLPDDQWGELVVAAVVAESGAQPDAQDLLAFAAKDLATYKRPRAIYFVDELPKSAAGKVLKRELKATLGEARTKESNG